MGIRDAGWLRAGLVRLFSLLAIVGLVAPAAQAGAVDGITGWPNRGRLGIEVQSMTGALREYFGAPEDRGVLVVRVDADRAAGSAGLRVGDVIIAVAGEAADKPLDLIREVARAPAGDPLALEVVRRGESLRIEVVPEGEALPVPSAEDWHSMREHVRKGLHEGTRQILQRLEEIERRLERMEQQKNAPPLEERT